MEEKKKSNTGLIIFICILLLACGSMGAFIFMNKDKIFVKEGTEQSESQVKENATKEDIDINSSLVTNLFNVFRVDKACYMNVKDLNNTNYTRLRLAYDNLFVPDEMVACSKVGVTYKESFCGNNFWGDEEISNAYSNDKAKFNKLLEERVSTKALNPKYLKAKFEELFGTDAEYKDEDFGVGHLATPTCYIMHYDEKNGIYAQYNCEGGGTCGGTPQTLSKAYKEGDKLYIETNYQDFEGILDEARKISKGKTKIIYVFKKDKINSNYVLEKVEEE